MDLRFHVLHGLDMTLSAGYATGWIEGERVAEAVIVSLTIL